jgi:hypothetical protein
MDRIAEEGLGTTAYAIPAHSEYHSVMGTDEAGNGGEREDMADDRRVEADEDIDPLWKEFLATMNARGGGTAAEPKNRFAMALVVGVPASLLLYGILYGVWKVIQAVAW